MFNIGLGDIIIGVGVAIATKPAASYVAEWFAIRSMDNKIAKQKKLAELEKARMQTDHELETYPIYLKKQGEIMGVVQEQQLLTQRIALQKSQNVALTSGDVAANNDEYYVKEVLRQFNLSQSEYRDWAMEAGYPKDAILRRVTVNAFLHTKGIATIA